MFYIYGMSMKGTYNVNKTLRDFKKSWSDLRPQMEEGDMEAIAKRVKLKVRSLVTIVSLANNANENHSYTIKKLRQLRLIIVVAQSVIESREAKFQQKIDRIQSRA